MAEPLNYLHQRSSDDWLVGYDSREFTDLAEELFQQLTRLAESRILPKILLAERNPVQFFAGFVAACAAGCPVFLGNPDWAKREWQQVLDLVQPDLIWQDGRHPLETPSGQDAIAKRGWIMIPTGGSSGQVRFAIHTWDTLMASVQGFQQYFQLKQINSCCVLPLYHVSGVMQFLRSFTSGGRLMVLPFQALESGSTEVAPGDFLSLVPTQLQRLLKVETAWLSRPTILLGGAPAWPQLLEAARTRCLQLALTYGMTETASGIATLKPEAFLRGHSSCGQVLPHAKVVICSPMGKVVGSNQMGIIRIEAGSLALGYYPAIFRNRQFLADDLGFFDPQGDLNVVGRQSNKIITGGENVFPAEVEAAIRATNLVVDVCVLGMPDPDWGEVVTAIYTPENPALATGVLQTALEDKLSRFKRPKHWIAVQALPRNAQGKINREQLQQIAMAAHRSIDVAIQS